MVAPLIVIALGLTTAGVLVFLRQCRLARVAQWLAAIGGILLGVALIYSVLQAPPPDQSLGMGLLGFLLTLTLLFALPRWLRTLTED